MKTLTSDKLNAEDQKHVLAAFIHRFTGQHKPAWANNPRVNGEPYPIQHATDADWLCNTKFYVTKSGRIDMQRRYCESTPSWPFNPELRKATNEDPKGEETN